MDAAEIRFAGVLIALILFGCSAPSGDISTSLGKSAAIVTANNALANQDCATAVAALRPLYNSVYTDNQVRMLMASAYACDSGVSFFKLIGDLSSNTSQLAGSGFWALMAKLFPSTIQDVVVEAAEFATDALFSVMVPGAVVPVQDMINSTTYNPGSILPQDRIADSNAFLIFVSMAQMGGLEFRYGIGDPSTANPAYTKNHALGVGSSGGRWAGDLTSQKIPADACAYASSIVNMIDGIGQTADNTVGALQTSLKTIQTTFSTVINTSCDAGCKGSAVPAPGVASGCTFSDCGSGPGKCPTSLRNRNSCTGLITDQNTCAAAGIINFINTNPLGWQG